MGASEGDRLGKLRQEIDGVRKVMQANISKVMARGEKLEDLEDRAGQLEMQAATFKKVADEVNELYDDMKGVEYEEVEVICEEDLYEDVCTSKEMPAFDIYDISSSLDEYTPLGLVSSSIIYVYI